MTHLAKYRTLAFITLIKLGRKNSIVDKEAHLGDFSAKIGISYNSYKKYRRVCLELGILKVIKGHDSYIGLQECIKVLGLPKINKYVPFFNKCKYDKVDFITIYNKIVEGIALNNFQQQQFKINNTKDLKRVSINICKNGIMTSTKDQAIVKGLIKAANDNKSDTLNYCKSILRTDLKSTKDSVTTGKYHLSSLLGMSPATGMNILRRMVKDNTIKRTVVKFNTSELAYTNDSFDYLCERYSKYAIIPCSSNKSFSVYKGSKIEIVKQ